MEKCADPARERPKVEQMVNAVVLAPFDIAAAAEAARIRAALEATGKSIGPYDLLLAGHARCLGLTLVTNNTSEFSRVHGLSLENWQTP